MKSTIQDITISPFLFTMSVLPDRNPEQSNKQNPSLFDTLTPVEAREGQLHMLNVDTTDLNEDELEYSLTTAPVGMEIGAQDGVIVWTPESGTAGEHPVIVQVDDGINMVEEEFVIRVLPARVTA